jgi:hypothetical protein
MWIQICWFSIFVIRFSFMCRGEDTAVLFLYVFKRFQKSRFLSKKRKGEKTGFLGDQMSLEICSDFEAVKSIEEVSYISLNL